MRMTGPLRRTSRGRLSVFSGYKRYLSRSLDNRVSGPSLRLRASVWADFLSTDALESSKGSLSIDADVTGITERQHTGVPAW